jgi:predicted LPLAT superfamily acyltransferase
MVDRLAMTASAHVGRNAGPSWGYSFLIHAQRLTPRWLLQPLLMAGTWVAVFAMKEERRHSRDYLNCVLGRRAGLVDVWRHFFAFLEFLLLRLRVASGEPTRCVLDPARAPEFEALLTSGEPALFGTFHFGHSDLLGFLLSRRSRRVAMIRRRVENSTDLDLFERQFGASVSFIWVNEPENLLFAIKAAIEAGASIALQCDRLEFTTKTVPLRFLGATRRFPFAIYHLAILFGRRVAFCLGVPEPGGGTRIFASPIYSPDPNAARAENLQRARDHFQAVLAELETLVRQQPTLWFNFRPLNPEIPDGAHAS